MRKVQYLSSKKSTDGGKEASGKTLKSSEMACMSAPGKNKVEGADKSQYLSVKKSDQINSARNRPCNNEKETTSRFSSCTAKTSPSTDNNSNGNAQAQEYWDAALHAKIG